MSLACPIDGTPLTKPSGFRSPNHHCPMCQRVFTAEALVAAALKASKRAALTLELQPWVEQKYRRWHKRFSLLVRKNGTAELEQTFEEYLADVLKNALDHMHDL